MKIIDSFLIFPQKKKISVSFELSSKYYSLGKWENIFIKYFMPSFRLKFNISVSVVRLITEPGDTSPNPSSAT